MPKALVFLVLVLFAAATVPGRVSGIVFPSNGASLTYTVTDMSNSSFGSIAAVGNDSYVFSELGDSWNVTEIFHTRITCDPSTGTLIVKYGTTSDILARNGVSSTNPIVMLYVSYIVRDRLIVSTPIGPNVPAAYYATCKFKGGAASIAGGTAALYAYAFKYYVFTYIDPTDIGQGSSVPVSIVVATICGTRDIEALGRPRTALVGTIFGFVSATMYWDQYSGILLWAKMITSLQTEQMQLLESPVLTT